METSVGIGVGTSVEIGVASYEPERLFSAAFWQACEREAAQLLRGLDGPDEA